MRPGQAIDTVVVLGKRIMSAPATDWYRQQGYSMQELVEGSPIVEVHFLEPDT